MSGEKLREFYFWGVRHRRVNLLIKNKVYHAFEPKLLKNAMLEVKT